MALNQIDITCERCGGVATLTSNRNGEELTICNFCGLLEGIHLNNNTLEPIKIDGIGYYRITNIDGVVETSIITNNNLENTIKEIKKRFEDKNINIKESYLSMYNEKTGLYEILLGEIDTYNKMIFEKWKKIDDMLANPVSNDNLTSKHIDTRA